MKKEETGENTMKKGKSGEKTVKREEAGVKTIRKEESGENTRERGGRNPTSGYYATPECVTELVLQAVDMDKVHTVCDLGCGEGSFLRAALRKNEQAEGIGVELSEELAEKAGKTSEEFGGRMRILHENAFRLLGQNRENKPGQNRRNDSDRKYDFVFFDFPFGIRAKTVAEDAHSLTEKITELGKTSSADWVYMALAMEMTQDNGKAVCLTSPGCLWDSTSENIRKYFVENGLIEAVILLPAGLIRNSSISTALVILSRGNQKIRMLDAKWLFKSERRHRTMSEEDVQEVIRGLKKDCEIACNRSPEEVRRNGYCLLPDKYRLKTSQIENSVPLGELVKDIRRGMPLGARDLDDLVTEEETGYRYLSVASIQNGIIHMEDLPRIRPMEKMKKFLLKEDDVVLSRYDSPFKIAVAGKSDDQIVVSGNLFMLTPNEKKIHPHYLAAWLDSKDGNEALSAASRGVTLPSLSVSELRQLEVPLPDKVTQSETAEERMRLLNALDTLTSAVEHTIRQLKELV